MVLTMPSNILPYLEALRFLWDWSAILLILQTCIFIAMTFIAIKFKFEASNIAKSALTFTIVFSALSILIGLNVIGTIPWSVQALPSLSIKYHDIYQYPNYIGIHLWIIAFGQHIFFVLAIISLVFFVCLYLKDKR